MNWRQFTLLRTQLRANRCIPHKRKDPYPPLRSTHLNAGRPPLNEVGRFALTDALQALVHLQACKTICPGSNFWQCGSLCCMLGVTAISCATAWLHLHMSKRKHVFRESLCAQLMHGCKRSSTTINTHACAHKFKPLFTAGRRRDGKHPCIKCIYPLAHCGLSQTHAHVCMHFSTHTHKLTCKRAHTNAHT